VNEHSYRLYESVVHSTSSELILFFVIAAVVALPLYGVMLKGRKAEKLHEREREALIINVIKENTGVIAGLKGTLDRMSSDVARISGHIERS